MRSGLSTAGIEAESASNSSTGMGLPSSPSGMRDVAWTLMGDSYLLFPGLSGGLCSLTLNQVLGCCGTSTIVQRQPWMPGCRVRTTEESLTRHSIFLVKTPGCGRHVVVEGEADGDRYVFSSVRNTTPPSSRGTTGKTNIRRVLVRGGGGGGVGGGERSGQRTSLGRLRERKRKKRKRKREGARTLYADATEEAVAASAGSGPGAPAEAPAGASSFAGAAFLLAPRERLDVLRDDVEARAFGRHPVVSQFFKFDRRRWIQKGSERGPKGRETVRAASKRHSPHSLCTY